MAKQKDEKTVAIHESGHAVAALVLGVEVVMVSLLRLDDDTSAGAQTKSAAWLARDRDSDERIKAYDIDACVSLAGPAAQIHYAPGKIRSPLPDEWQQDTARAQSAVIQATLLEEDPQFDPKAQGQPNLTSARQAKMQARMARLNAAVDKLVRDHWVAIERTANELMRLRIISGEEVDAIVSQASQTAAS